ncbi:hypothetical protein ABLN97_05270 [Mycobacterium tuberculosis]
MICDEPTTALDVTSLDVLKAARDVLAPGCAVATHDLGVVAGDSPTGRW